MPGDRRHAPGGADAPGARHHAMSRRRTKIRAKYLRALENEEWGMLPGSTFVKSFLRTYAEELGLDPHLIVEEYRAHHEEPDELELQPFATPSRPGREPRRYRPGPPPPGVALALIVVGVLAFLIVLGLSGRGRRGGDRRARPPPRRRRRGAPRSPRSRAGDAPAGGRCGSCPRARPTSASTAGADTDVALRGHHHRAGDLPRQAPAPQPRPPRRRADRQRRAGAGRAEPGAGRASSSRPTRARELPERRGPPLRLMR